MILADTSIWIDHLRSQNSHLASLLRSISLGVHPMVIGELACGTLPNRAVFLRQIQNLPRLLSASDDELLSFIDRYRIMGRGIGYIDAHLLAAAKLNGAKLWTGDKRLHKIASDLHVEYIP
jgi:predicted nucleic acid-binding protein